jgi:class 3 adenylate cyclase
VSIAYQVTGTGPLDLVFLPPLTIPVDLLAEEPSFARVVRRLGGFSRTVWCELRGMGASGGHVLDRFVEEKVDADLTAILDAAGCERVVLVGSDQTGINVIRYALAHPGRVTALILIHTWAHYVREADYPVGVGRDDIDRYADSAGEVWGTGSALRTLAPSRIGDEGFRTWWARCERLGDGADDVSVSIRASFRGDVRELLPTVTVPTLVLHREGNRYIRVEAGRYLAEHIPGAKSVELSGDDHMFWVGDTDAVLDEVEEFLTGSHQAPDGDVVTASVLLTDIVASTEQAARVGHRKWTTLTDDHDAAVRSILHRYRGREIKTVGDGFLATFDATTRAVRAATEIVAAAKGKGLNVRAGVHTGEVEFRQDDVVGLAVSIAKRICDLAGPGTVFVSETVKGHLVGSGIGLSEQGTHVLKGVPETWRLFAVEM